MKHQDLYTGLIRLHILHHAAEESVFGFGIMEELGRHGYRLGAGTVYPLLHSMEKKGYLRSKEEKDGQRIRRVYRATRLGKQALAEARQKVKELFSELMEGEKK